MAWATFFLFTILSCDLPVCMCGVVWLQAPPSNPITGPLSPPSLSPPSFCPPPHTHTRENMWCYSFSVWFISHDVLTSLPSFSCRERLSHFLWGVKLDGGHVLRFSCLSTDGHLCWFHTWCAGVSAVLLTLDSSGMRCSWIIWWFYLQKLPLRFL